MKKNKKNYLKYKIFLAGYPKREITLKILTYIFSRIKTSLFYRFFKIGANSFIDHRAVIDGSNFISIGSNCFIHRNAWLAVPLFEAQNTIPFKTLDIYNSVRSWRLNHFFPLSNPTRSSSNSKHHSEHVGWDPNRFVNDAAAIS